MKPHKHAELIKAWADGAEIEEFDTFTRTWEDAPNPSWRLTKYRIKPEPKPDEMKKPVGQICTGCGTSWSDERLEREKQLNDKIISCCPERKMVDVYTLTEDELYTLHCETMMKATDVFCANPKAGFRGMTFEQSLKAFDPGYRNPAKDGTK